MPISPARIAAFEILLRIEQEAAYASELLHSQRYANLSTADHALATELVMGVLRWQSLLDDSISQASSQKLSKLDGEVLTSLRLGTYQIFYLGRIPARAAIHESVELVKRARKRSAATFVNAVLRKLADLPQPAILPIGQISAATTVETLSRSSAHPQWMVERWIAQFGFEKTKSVCLYNQTIPDTTVRLRTSAAEKELQHEGIRLSSGSLLSEARRVKSGNVNGTKTFADGHVVIQDEASQLVALLVGKATRILDCCAAPGGKTCILSDRNPQSTIIAADLRPQRARLLGARVNRKNVHILAADALHFPLLGGFDRVLADVPCSGTGTMAHHPEIKWRLRAEDLSDLRSRQTKILRSAMSQVIPGGKLVYSTCTLEAEENSQVVEEALASDASFELRDCRTELEELQHQGDLVLDNIASILSGKFLQILPGQYRTDGFFAAVLERTK